MLQNFSPEILPEEYATSYKKKSPNPNHWKEFVYNSKEMWLEDIWIPKEILPKIESKVLVLFGDRDPFIPLNHSIKIYNDLIFIIMHLSFLSIANVIQFIQKKLKMDMLFLQIMI